jgi:hypothetical protein
VLVQQRHRLFAAGAFLDVTSRSFGVMMLATGWSSWVSKRRSRLVTMPTTLPPSITGRPEMRLLRVMSSTWRTVICGATVIGSLTTPDSKRLTAATWAACISAFMFLWMMPMPPSCARAIARRASVTVSMAADRRGRFRVMLRVNCVAG